MNIDQAKEIAQEICDWYEEDTNACIRVIELREKGDIQDMSINFEDQLERMRKYITKKLLTI